MTKQKAIQSLFGKHGTNKQLAAALKVSEAAVSKWDDDKIPKLREFQVKDLVKKKRAKA